MMRTGRVFGLLMSIVPPATSLGYDSSVAGAAWTLIAWSHPNLPPAQPCVSLEPGGEHEAGDPGDRAERERDQCLATRA